MKSGIFKTKPYEPGQGYRLKQTRSLQSNTRLRKKSVKLIPLKVSVGNATRLLWHTAYADTQFSQSIRKRDGCCLRCGSTENLTCSHFFGRGNSSTRYDPENCDTLCQKCHGLWEVKKREGQIYYRFKAKQLGFEKFAELKALAAVVTSRETAIKDCMKLLLVS